MAGLANFAKDKPNLMQVACARYDVTKDKTGKILFTLPRGAVLSGACSVSIMTVFNGTTPTVTIGNLANPSLAGSAQSFMQNAEVAPTVLGAKGMNLPGTMTAAGLGVPLGSDTDVTITVGGGGANTLGVIVVMILFAYPALLSDLL